MKINFNIRDVSKSTMSKITRSFFRYDVFQMQLAVGQHSLGTKAIELELKFQNFWNNQVTRSGKGNQPLNIKTGVDWPILKLESQVELLFYFTSCYIPPFQTLFYDVIHATFHCSSASFSILLKGLENIDRVIFFKHIF